MRKVMEPKVIKEENVDKDLTGLVEAPRTRSTKAAKDRCKTPDSPEGARHAAAPHSPSHSSPLRHPSTSPVNGGSRGGSTDSLTPPLPASTALSVNLDTTQPPAGYSFGTYASGIASTRPLVKVKRFLSTLVQFGGDISGDIGERVRTLVLNLVSSNLSLEEFHHSLQDVTNFPLRPFVMPFLRTHLPLLQREVNALARANKQSTLQYLRSHDHVILDAAHSPSEISDIFISNDTSSGTKRKIESVYENGLNGHNVHLTNQEAQDYSTCSSANKRTFTSQGNPFYFSHHSLFMPTMTSSLSNAHLFDYSSFGSHQSAGVPQNVQENIGGSSRGDEEWKNIHVMLNCILSMVEKTKRALSILQQRNSQELPNDWLRKQDPSADLKKAANEIMVQAVRQTEERVAEVKKKAEEAVTEVKKQAVLELQKAVAAAEGRANEIIALEKVKMEKILTETKNVSSLEDSTNHQGSKTELSLSPPNSNQPPSSQQNACWNCGRKAHETCSGCGIARYCGSFCQHKDWESHHQICSNSNAKDKTLRSTVTTGTPPSGGTVSPQISVDSPNGPVAVKFKK